MRPRTYNAAIGPNAPEKLATRRAELTVQDESQASYEGWCRAAEAHINWHNHIDPIYNLIRGCNPAPGAWTTVGGKRLHLLDSRKHVFQRFAQVRGTIAR
jgi:methionyl-tRNA formyltransferase